MNPADASNRRHRDRWETIARNPEKIVYTQNPYHDYFRALPFLAVRRRFNLNGQSVLIASCGSGIDLFYLRQFFPQARFHVSDIAEAAVAMTTSRFQVPGSVQDNERLSFPDGAFDYSFIAASLHHLARPHLGLYELLRVARKGVIAIEPHDTWLTRLATACGWAADYEPACGNFVFRYADRDVRKIARSLFCDWSAEGLFATHRVARSAFEFALLKALNSLANRLAPQWGNYLVFSITRPDPALLPRS